MQKELGRPLNESEQPLTVDDWIQTRAYDENTNATDSEAANRALHLLSAASQAFISRREFSNSRGAGSRTFRITLLVKGKKTELMKIQITSLKKTLMTIFTISHRQLRELWTTTSVSRRPRLDSQLQSATACNLTPVSMGDWAAGQKPNEQLIVSSMLFKLPISNSEPPQTNHTPAYLITWPMREEEARRRGSPLTLKFCRRFTRPVPSLGSMKIDEGITVVSSKMPLLQT